MKAPLGNILVAVFWLTVTQAGFTFMLALTTPILQSTQDCGAFTVQANRNGTANSDIRLNFYEMSVGFIGRRCQGLRLYWNAASFSGVAPSFA